MGNRPSAVSEALAAYDAREREMAGKCGYHGGTSIADQIRRGIFRRTSDDEIWNDLVTNREPSVRMGIAQLEAELPLETLKKLAQDPDAIVRCMVAARSGLPREIHQILESDSDIGVKKALIQSA